MVEETVDEEWGVNRYKARETRVNRGEGAEDLREDGVRWLSS